MSEGVDYTGAQGNFRGIGNVLYLDGSDSYTTLVFIRSHNSIC